MATKKKICTIATFALVLGLVLAGQAWGQTRFGPRTEPFFKIFESGTFHMKAAVTGPGIVTDMEIHAKDGRIATVTSSQGMTARIIFRDGKTYMIMDSEKMILVTATPPEVTSATGMKNDGSVEFVGSGTATFAGKNLPYDEYAADNGTVLYFVDGNRLAGFRTVSPGIGTIDTVVSVLDQNVPDSVFTVPSSGYQVQDMSNFSF